MDKVKARALTETTAIKAEVQSIIYLVKKTDQGQNGPSSILKIEDESLKRGVIDTHRLEQWLEDMY